MSSLLVRRLRLPDLPLLEEIERAHFANAPQRAGWLAGFRSLLERSLSEEPEGVMIAEREGALAGSAIARQRGVHPLTGRRYGELLHLSVAKKHQRKGVGTRLLRECEAYLRSRGCEAVHLLVPVDSGAGEKLLKKAGYEVTGWQMERALRRRNSLTAIAAARRR